MSNVQSGGYNRGEAVAAKNQLAKMRAIRIGGTVRNAELDFIALLERVVMDTRQYIYDEYKSIELPDLEAA